MKAAVWELLRIKNQAPLWRVIGHSLGAFLANDLTTSAAAIAYYVMLMLFPLLILLISIGQTLYGEGEVQQFLAGRILALLPGTREFVGESLEALREVRTGAIISSVIIVLWAASWVFTVLEKAVNRIWGTPARSFAKGKLLTVGMAGLSVVILGFSTLFTAFLAFVRTTAAGVSPGLPQQLVEATLLAWQGLLAVGTLLATIGLFAIIYKVMPNRHVPWIETLPGAIISGIVYEALKNAFAHLLPMFLEEYRLLYGGMWLALVLMTWCYMSSIVVLFGAQVTALLHGEHLFSND